MIVIKFISLVFAIWFSIINFALITYKENVSWDKLLIQSVSIATFIFLQFELF